VADFLAGRSTTSSRRGKIVGGPELRVRGQRVDVVKDFEMVVLNRFGTPFGQFGLSLRDDPCGPFEQQN